MSYLKGIKLEKGSDIASASALTIPKDGNYFDVTGTTTVTSINTVAVDTVITLQFDAAVTLTHHATDLILPGGANITTAAGDEFTFLEYATGDWKCIGYTLASGEAVVGGGSSIMNKVTLTTADLTAAAATQTVNLFSLPHGEILTDIVIKAGTAFTGGGATIVTVEVGISGDNDKYATAFDIFQTVGDTVAKAYDNYALESMATSGSTQVTATFISDVNVNAITAGSVDIYYQTKAIF